jgi:hypothetical protein
MFIVVFGVYLKQLNQHLIVFLNEFCQEGCKYLTLLRQDKYSYVLLYVILVEINQSLSQK